MMKPEVRQVFTGSQTYDAQVYSQIMKPGGLVSVLDREGVEWANIISYPAPEVMGFDHKLVEFVGNYCREYPDRLRPVVSVDPVRDENPVNLLEDYRSRFGSNWIKLHPVHQLFKPNAYTENKALYSGLAKTQNSDGAWRPTILDPASLLPPKKTPERLPRHIGDTTKQVAGVLPKASRDIDEDNIWLRLAHNGCEVDKTQRGGALEAGFTGRNHKWDPTRKHTRAMMLPSAFFRMSLTKPQ